MFLSVRDVEPLAVCANDFDVKHSKLHNDLNSWTKSFNTCVVIVQIIILHRTIKATVTVTKKFTLHTC